MAKWSARRYRCRTRNGRIWGVALSSRARKRREVCRIWGEVLGMERIGIHDDFFELGGLSLMVMRAVTTINDRFKSDLSPVAMFEHRTVASLSPLLKEAEQNGASVASQIGRAHVSTPVTAT